MQTLTDTFREQLNLPLPKEGAAPEDPKISEALEHVSKLFQEAVDDPKRVAAFHELYQKIKNAPRDANGVIQIDQDISSTITINKIEKW